MSTVYQSLPRSPESRPAVKLPSLRLIPPLPSGEAGDEGVIGAHSLVWPIAAEKAVLIGGLSATLLQVAHPLVAAGVAEHSMFQSDPLQRLIGTLQAVLVTTFGDQQQAHLMAQHVAELHRPVHGSHAGRPYSALNPELCLWVYATLVELALDSYSLLFRQLTDAERATYYHQTKPFAKLFRVTRALLPASYAEFREYYLNMLEHLVVSDQARDIAADLWKSKLYGLPVSGPGRLVAAALLPSAKLRQAYGLRWDPTAQRTWRVVCCLLRGALRYTPPRLRQWHHYRVAQRRLMSVS